jgi:hypothetical protein
METVMAELDRAPTAVNRIGADADVQRADTGGPYPVGASWSYGVPMASEVEHPDIRYVVYPVHLDGTPTEPIPDCDMTLIAATSNGETAPCWAALS